MTHYTCEDTSFTLDSERTDLLLAMSSIGYGRLWYRNVWTNIGRTGTITRLGARGRKTSLRGRRQLTSGLVLRICDPLQEIVGSLYVEN